MRHRIDGGTRMSNLASAHQSLHLQCDSSCVHIVLLHLGIPHTYANLLAIPSHMHSDIPISESRQDVIPLDVKFRIWDQSPSHLGRMSGCASIVGRCCHDTTMIPSRSLHLLLLIFVVVGHRRYICLTPPAYDISHQITIISYINVHKRRCTRGSNPTYLRSRGISTPPPNELPRPPPHV